MYSDGYGGEEEEGMVLGCFLEVEVIGFVDRLDVKCRGRRELSNFLIFVLNSWVGGGVVYWDGEGWGKGRFESLEIKS